ncbi:hypothetical protein H4CHR_01935 [Variovorax sp. PBS-H4]|uniref:hypothetical protein n=1 Tax=Variovorax sp. PBS-H4 TaxID=434008 RepID=UPI0013183F14|nr:hypothetical protein [Variovorax sp. PBS-H4]VTU27143.1 hypothetical protein H4CHR_01935 [Variovorax sp. PBS-H4]
MGQSTPVEITLPNSNKVWTIDRAGPDADGDYSDAYSMRVGIGQVAKLMVSSAKELNGYSAEVEWDAHALTTIETLSGSIQNWAANRPTAQDLMMLYDSGIIQATPDQVHMEFATTLPKVYADQGYVIDIRQTLVDVDLEDIKRVPPEYPNWNPSSGDEGVYERPDGTYFNLRHPPADLHPPPHGQVVVVDPESWQEWDVDLSQTKYTVTDMKSLLPTWIGSLSALKDDLTKQSQTQMAYLQNVTEQYDRMIGFLQALIEAMRKVLAGLVR